MHVIDMDPLAGILVLLVTAKVLGELVEYAGYPSLIGEVVAGIILGPSVFGFIEMTPVIQFFGRVGVILLLFITGLEINQKIFRSARDRMIVTGLTTSIVPFVFGILLAPFLSLSPHETLFVAILFSLSSIAMTVRVLLEVRQLNTDFGMTIVGAAAVCTITGIILFGMLSAIQVEGTVTLLTLLYPLVIALIFIILISTAGRVLFRFLFDKVQILQNRAFSYAAAFFFACGSAFISQVIGITYVVGAFFAGIALSENIQEDSFLHESLVTSAFGIFICIFFASVGLLVNLPLRELLTPMIIPVVVVAIGAKILAGFIGSYPFLRDRGTALLVGLGMVTKGDLILALAQSAILTGLISQQVYTATIVVVVVTILLTPVFLKVGLDRLKKGQRERGVPVTEIPSGQGRR
jgi:Kef-type K+ transport system membrane component KefB